MTNLNYLIYTKNYSMQQYLSIMVCLTLLSYRIFNIKIHIISITLLLWSTEKHVMAGVWRTEVRFRSLAD